MQFVHLNLHTEYSITDGIVRLEELMPICGDYGLPAVALTDQNNLFAQVKFYKQAIANGIKPLFGIDTWIAFNSFNLTSPLTLHKCILLAQNPIGLNNIVRLISRAYVERHAINEKLSLNLSQPTILQEWIEENNNSQNIIMLSGAQFGIVGTNLLQLNNTSENTKNISNLLKNPQLNTIIAWHKKYFADRFYLELQRIGRNDDETYIQLALNCAEQYDLPVVATNAVRFLNQDDFEAHEARVCINAGYILADTQRHREFTSQQYLRSTAEMCKLFADIPSAIINTVEIAKRCNVTLQLGKSFLPIFPIPENIDLNTFFITEANHGLRKRLAKNTTVNSNNNTNNNINNNTNNNTNINANTDSNVDTVTNANTNITNININTNTQNTNTENTNAKAENTNTNTENINANTENINAENITTNTENTNAKAENITANTTKTNANAENLVVPEEYQQRLDYELNVIQQMGFQSYFLIVADFIRWAKNNGIPVGPGRGSGAGSLVAYVLEITDLDPLQHSLLFERFLNPERVSLPDFDVDFCMEGRDRVIDYVIQHYGSDKVSQIITYGTMAAKAVVRDVGRVLGYPYGFVDKIAKLIPFELGIDLNKALHDEPLLRKRYNEEDDVKSLIDLAKKLEGITRNAGKHAGGVVIAPSALTDFVPLYCEENDANANAVTQFDKDDVEAVGLVKFDFLGLRTLTIINWAVENINAKRLKNQQPIIDITSIPLNDEATYKLLQKYATIAVFQLESRGMRELIKRLQPDCFEDIVALVALYRPGPLQSGMVDDFIERKHGRAKVSYFHPSLEPVLNTTYGVILYQEQVMQIAQVLAGYSLGSADILRRAMGKKKPEEMALQRTIFIDGAVKKNIDKHLANQVFDLMEKFAGYGFNKSHSVAYALVSYQTAWLKTHFPAEFMASVLSSDMDNTDKVVIFLQECKSMQINIIPPDINQSMYKFTVDDSATSVIYGLGAIKAVGQNAVEIILNERQQNGNFKDLGDFCCRCDSRKVNKRVVEALIHAGAFDKIAPNRASSIATMPLAFQLAEHQGRNKAQGQLDFFSLTENEEENNSQPLLEYTIVEEWNETEKLTYEKNVVGLYLTGHPIDKYLDEIKKYAPRSIQEISDLQHNSQATKVTIAGIITNVRNFITKSGKRLVIINLEDHTSNIEITLFADFYEKNQHLLHNNELIVTEVEISIDKFTEREKAKPLSIKSLEQTRIDNAKSLVIKLKSNTTQKSATSSQSIPQSIQKSNSNTTQKSIQEMNVENVKAEDAKNGNVKTKSLKTGSMETGNVDVEGMETEDMETEEVNIEDINDQKTNNKEINDKEINTIVTNIANVLRTYTNPNKTTSNKTCQVYISYNINNLQANIKLHDKWQITPKNELLEQLNKIEGIEKIEIG